MIINTCNLYYGTPIVIVVGILERISIPYIMQFIHADVKIFMTRKFRASLASMSRALGGFYGLSVFPLN